MSIFSSIRPGRAASAIAAAIASAALAASLIPSSALADSRVVATIGADLTDEQEQLVENYFGKSMENAQVIYVTIQDEHAHLDAYVPAEQIGNGTYSCALISPTTSGGIHVRAANLTYVTADMLASALATAGVRNADVIAICPFKVSGTGALTGVMMAYETATGEALDETKKDIATNELVVTQSLADQVGPDVATMIVNDVKATVINNNITDETEINNVVNETINNVINNTTINNTTNNVVINNGDSSAADSTADNSATSDASATADNSADTDTADTTDAADTTDTADATAAADQPDINIGFDIDLSTVTEVGTGDQTTTVDQTSTADTDQTTTVDQTSGDQTQTNSQVATQVSQLSDEDIAALKDLAQRYAQADYNYEDMSETLETVSQNTSKSAGIQDPMAEEIAQAASSTVDASASSDGEAKGSSASSGADGSAASDSGKAEGLFSALFGTDETETADDDASSDTAASSGADETGEAEVQDEEPSIFDGTNDAALGEDTIVTVTDQSAGDSTVADEQPAEAAPEPAAPAEEPAAEPEPATAEEPATTTDENDPFADLTWDDTDPQATEANEADPNAVQTPAEQTDQAEQTDADAAASTTDETDATETPEATVPVINTVDTAGAPVPAQGDGVTLNIRTGVQASDLIDGTALIAYADAATGTYGLVDIDGNQVAEPQYTDNFTGTDGYLVATRAADGRQVLLDPDGAQVTQNTYSEIKVLNSSWALGYNKNDDGTVANVDIYDLTALTADNNDDTLATTLTPIANLSADSIVDAQAQGEYINIVDATGVVTAYGPGFVLVDGAAPVSVDDFSYANAPADEAPETTEAVDAGATEEAAVAEEVPAETAEAADLTSDVDLGSLLEAVTDATGISLEPGEANAAEAVVDSPLSEATVIANTNDKLYVETDQTGLVHVLDATGADLFAGQGFDQVISTQDGATLVVVDKTDNVAWAYDVAITL